MTVLVTPLFVVLLLFVVCCARTASASIDVYSAASAAARAASMARTATDARLDAIAAASRVLVGRSVTCVSLSVAVDTSTFRRGGAVTAAVRCTVALSDLGLLGVPATRVISGTATTPIDIYRQVSDE